MIASSASRRLPLDGIRVLDLSRIIAGPNCTQNLADLGAEVIKVERPDGGDDARHMMPPAQHGTAAFFLAFNRNKRSVAIDLKSARGRELVGALAAVSDVVMENFRPGVAGRLGIDYASLKAINPGLVYCSVSAYGQTGSMSDRPGLDPVLQAEFGLMAVTGEPDGRALRHPVSLTDLTASLLASTGICAALVRRQRDGLGEHIDLSLMGAAVYALGNLGVSALSTGEDPPRMGNGHPSAAPVGAFHGSDGAAFYIACGNDRLFARLAQAVQAPALAGDARFLRNADRCMNRAPLTDILAKAFASAPRTTWVERLRAAGIPAGPVRSIVEALASPEVAEAGLVQNVPSGAAGTLRLLRSPLNLASAPERQDRAPPRLGEHTDEILRGLLQLDDERLAALRRDGVIG